MATNAPHALDVRADAIARGAAQWRDPASVVRVRAREALAGGLWPAPVVETALDNVLWDLDEKRARELCNSTPFEPASSTVVVLPGNIIGPAIQSAYCAAIAGAHALLKASSAERFLAEIVSAQFEQLGPPLAGSVHARYWPGGDIEAEADAIAGADRAIVFGDDATIEQIRARSGDIAVISYGEAYSVGYVPKRADTGIAAVQTARDVCLFDQRGCMSPQSVYVEGDSGRAVLFAHALARAIADASRTLPRAAFEPDEAALVAGFARGLAATVLGATPHGLDTLLPGPLRGSVPEFIVAVHPFGQPVCAGFGRIVVVMPCPGARDVAAQLKHHGRHIDSIGVADGAPERDHTALRLASAVRLCALGDMQRPPFGYRPSPRDFIPA